MKRIIVKHNNGLRASNKLFIKKDGTIKTIRKIYKKENGVVNLIWERLNSDISLLQFENNITDAAGNIWNPTGTPVYVDGKIGSSAIRFNDGSGFSHLLSNSVISSLNFSTNIDFTIEFWFRVNARVNDFMSIITNNYTAWNGTNRFVMFYGDNADPSSSRGKIGLGGRNIGTNNLIVSSTSTITNNTWNHFAVTRSGNLFTLYLNGIAESTYTGSIAFDFSTNGTVIGRNRWDSGSNGLFTGDLDQLRIINQCLYTKNFTPATIPYPSNS